LFNVSASEEYIITLDVLPDDSIFADAKTITIDLNKYEVFVYIGGFIRWLLTLSMVLFLIKFVLVRYYSNWGVSL
ncbi:MAG: hypothetical protein D3910_21885, partial [Candidatus Electrothrix sp. ATG2]|nr:hypothetical protein [Candidatus Electrothrix sp. ATG2]